MAILVYYFDGGIFTPLAILNLFFPLLLVAACFCSFLWIFINRKIFLVSILPIVLAILVFGTFYNRNNSQEVIEGAEDVFSLLTFNVMAFNKYESIKQENIGDSIIAFINKVDPDIVCLQEHSRIRFKQLPQYKYRAETPYSQDRSIQAIFSKYPIVDHGSLNLPNTTNNIIFADIQKGMDTLRIYNFHLQSYGIVPSSSNFTEQESERNLKKVFKAFTAQLQQAKILSEHRKSNPYSTILAGDLNNTQFSNVYRILKSDFQDSFTEQGQGFGTTYRLFNIPLRIDFIFTDDSFNILSHKNFELQLSDHDPILSHLRLKSDE